MIKAPELCLAQDNGTFSCTGKPNGFYADPENCRYYFECEPNGMFHFLCENDWLYDEGTTYCDYQDRVECGSRPLCDSDGNNCQERKLPLTDLVVS